MLHRGGFLLLVSCVAATAAFAQEVPQAFTGARIIPVEGEPIDAGTLVVEAGVIKALGPAGKVEIPATAKRFDLKGKVIIPGLICTHSHIGGIGGGDGSGPVQPEVRIYDSLNVRDSGFRRAVAGGLTTLNIMPGSGHLLSGQTVYVKLRGSKTIEGICLRDKEGRILGGMKMANGTNSQRAPPFPGTRAKSAALMRAEFIRAGEYRDKLAAALDEPDKKPPRDLRLEGLVEVLEGRRVVHHHTHRHDDIMTVLRLSREFGFRVVLHHVSEGWMVAEEIARAKGPCSIILVDSPGGSSRRSTWCSKPGGSLRRPEC